MTTVKKLEFEGLCFEVRFRPVKYSRIEFSSAVPVMVVPFGADPISVLKQKKQAILKKHAKVVKQMKAARRLPIASRSEKNLSETVERFAQQFSDQLKVKYRVIRYRKMKRRWGSCRSDGYITLNRCLCFLPERLIAYIVFHEMAHLIISCHNKKFKTLISKQFPHFKTLEKELKLYGHRLLL